METKTPTTIEARQRVEQVAGIIADVGTLTRADVEQINADGWIYEVRDSNHAVITFAERDTLSADLLAVAWGLAQEWIYGTGIEE